MRTLRNLRRLLAIARTLARHNALFPLERLGLAPAITTLARLLSRRDAPGREGERLAAAAQALGPSFIKLGQAISTRPDLVGEALASDLAMLQDELPPIDGTAIKAIVARDLGAPLDSLYRHFDTTPLAAASIAQVHLAETSEGTLVAVKVLRPGIEQTVARDVELFRWLARLAERALPAWRRLKPLEVVDTFAEVIAMEMDLRLEAAAASELGQNFAEDESFLVPAVDWRRTSRRVLTLGRISGIPIDERQALIDAGHDPDAIVAKAGLAFFKQVFRDGFFHADLHPGNLFVTAEGAIAAVDFGIMGRLDRPTRRYLGEMLLGFLDGDYRRVAEIHFEAGYVGADKSRAAFTQACRSIGEPILGRPAAEISIAKLLGQLFQVTETFAMETQPQLLLLQKTMVLAEGVSRGLNPDVNMWHLARPLIDEWVAGHLSAEARLRETAQDGLTQLQRLPALLGRIEAAATALEGGIRIHPDSLRQLAAERRRRQQPFLWLAATALLVLVVALIA